VRKLKLQMQMSLDGFVAGPKGEMDWMSFNWDEVLVNYVTELTNSVDTIVMGRKLAEGFIPHWKGVAEDANSPENAVGKTFTDLPKIVFTNTIQESQWENTKVSKNIPDEIMELKKQPGKDIIVYGGASFVSDLIKHNLIDEYHLFVNPVIIGNGMSIFKDTDRKNLGIVKTTTSSSGIVVLFYQPK
jgi:dihydrofolate reductase